MKISDILDHELRYVKDKLKNEQGIDVYEKKALNIEDFSNAIGMITTSPILMAEILSKDNKSDMLMSFSAIFTTILFDKGDDEK